MNAENINNDEVSALVTREMFIRQSKLPRTVAQWDSD